MRRRNHQCRGSSRFCFATECHCGIRTGVSAAHDDGHRAVDLVDDHAHQLSALVLRERVPLAGVAEDANAVSAALDHEPYEPALALHVDTAIVVKRGVDDGKDSGEGRHEAWNSVGTSAGAVLSSA